MAILSGAHKGKAQMEWNREINRARDAFLDAYYATHGHPIGGTAAWYGSAQYQALKSQEPYAQRG